MTKAYRFTIEGIDARGAYWETGGVVSCEFYDAWHLAVGESFRQLTDGEAVYGCPGKGCHGPYRIIRVLIEELKH